ncbi:MAG: SelD-related putative sulfur metabolism protein [Nitrososphaeraceae archaeon]|nr:SelD-related putative sulfur metabolism protein [Nitrososphaeraceae archaeon]
MNTDFWDNIYKYKEYGFEPLSWLSTFSNEIDPDLLESSLNKIKGTNWKIIPEWFDWFYKSERKNPEVTRRIYNLSDLYVQQSETGIKKALAIIQLNKEIVDNQEKRLDLLSNLINSIKSKCITKKISVINTSSKKQFALLDFVETRRGNKVGYIIANNYITQVTDVLSSPESDLHCKITVAGVIENLNLLGCIDEFKIFPIYDAPKEEMLDVTRQNLDSITLSNNIYMEDYSSLKIGNLFFGASATATTYKEIPTRYTEIEEEMNVIITDKFGSIIPLSLFLLTKINEENISVFEKHGIVITKLENEKDNIINNLSHPRFELGKLINKYCPAFEGKFDKASHITAVFPILTQGILAIKKLVDYIDHEIIIDKIPIKNKEMSSYAVKEYLVQHSTSSFNGCHLIIASRECTDSIIQDLKKIHLEPEVIGKVGKKGKPLLNIKDIEFDKYILRRSKINKKIRSFRAKGFENMDKDRRSSLSSPSSSLST